MKVELTKDQCVNVAEFIEIHLIDAIRADESIENIAWLESMLDARRALEKAVNEYENG